MHLPRRPLTRSASSCPLIHAPLHVPQGKKVVRAKLGQKNKMVYDEKVRKDALTLARDFDFRVALRRASPNSLLMLFAVT